MPDLKISALPAASTPLDGTEIVPVVQGGTTDRATVANLTAGRAVAGLSFTATGGTVTASAPVLNGTQTWNNAGVTFTAFNLNTTDTASGANSRLISMQVGGSDIWWVRKDGFHFYNSAAGLIWSGRGVFSLPANGQYRFQNSAQNATVDLTVTNNIATFSTPVKVNALTVATLPAATAGAGTKSFVTDANATTFASIVAGGGSNGVPVYSDGTNWRIG